MNAHCQLIGREILIPINIVLLFYYDLSYRYRKVTKKLDKFPILGLFEIYMYTQPDTLSDS